MVIVFTYAISIIYAYRRGKVFYYPHPNGLLTPKEKQFCFYSALSTMFAFVLFGAIVNTSMAFQNFGYQIDPESDAVVSACLLLAYGTVGATICEQNVDYPYFFVASWTIWGVIRKQQDIFTLYKNQIVVIAAFATIFIMLVGLIWGIVKSYRINNAANKGEGAEDGYANLEKKV